MSLVKTLGRAASVVLTSIALCVGIGGTAYATDAPEAHRIRGVYFPSAPIPPEATALANQGISLYGPGTPVFVGNLICTVTAAGHDSNGRAMAITAGHCGPVGTPVTSMDSPEAGVSGTVVRTSDNPKYGVIELKENTRVTTSYGRVAADGIGGGGVGPGALLCKNGISTGWTCGPSWQFPADSHYLTQVCATHGDSGAPVLLGNRIVGIVEGSPGPISCRFPIQGPFFTPTDVIDMQAVLNSLNAGPGPGHGFRLG
ncbi:trypsin [Corynebacterium kroppenstedtii]|uniref:trypsin n=1 Tax=Corynebacterium sp. PCR 32 TaxID=3351342 RepID=UPI0030A73D42